MDEATIMDEVCQGQNILQDLLTGCDFSCDSELAPFFCMSDGVFLPVQITLWLPLREVYLQGLSLKRAKPEVASPFIASSLVSHLSSSKIRKSGLSVRDSARHNGSYINEKNSVQ